MPILGPPPLNSYPRKDENMLGNVSHKIGFHTTFIQYILTFFFISEWFKVHLLLKQMAE